MVLAATLELVTYTTNTSLTSSNIMPTKKTPVILGTKLTTAHQTLWKRKKIIFGIKLTTTLDLVTYTSLEYYWKKKSHLTLE